MSSYRTSARTTPTRQRDRVGYDRAGAHAVLDAAYICHLGFVVDGEPVVLPTIHARVDERLYLHASTGARAMLRRSDTGLQVCVTVTLLDGLVLARSAFHHSMNYRSVVVHGRARPVRDRAEQEAALTAIVDHVVPGRAADCRPPSARELAATSVLRLDLDEVSVKVRRGGPVDDDDDLALPYWAGVIPLRLRSAEPVPAADLASGVPVPAYLSRGRVAS